MTENSLKLPENLLLGVATAATHIEGGEIPSNWYRWSELGKIKDGSHSRVACDHVNRIDSDVELISDLHCQTYRMGIEWARIEPEEGKFSKEGIELYRRELILLKEKEIVPLVTLWHFSNPLWMEDDGSWVNPKSVDRFLKLVEVVVNELGDLVEDWITINEPNVYLFYAYFEGTWPPGKKGSIADFIKAANHLAQAHLKAYERIHQKYADQKVRVGVAHHLRVFDPLDERWLTRAAVKLTTHIFQGMFLEAMTSGTFRFPMSESGFSNKGKIYADFIAINYYSRDMIRGVLNPGSLFGERQVMQGSNVNDLGWEIYPEGLYRVCKEVFDKYRLPIFITENGTCDANDAFRKEFILEHLKMVKKAISEEIPIERYYHWSLMDNFEWAEGNSARFGLYHTNYETQERTLRKSGEYFREVCKTRIL